MFKFFLYVLMAGTFSAHLYALPSTTRVSGSFHGIVVRGDLDIAIHQTSGPSYAIAHGDSLDLIYLEFEVKKDWLKINLGKGYPHYGKMSVDIWVNDLHRLVQRKNARVIGHQLNSSSLIVSAIGCAPVTLDGHINLKGLQVKHKAHVEIAGVQSESLSMDLHQNAYVKLQGTMKLCDIQVYDKSWLSMYWVKANRLTLSYGDSSFVQMAGRVNVLDLEMYQHAKFAGRYLRVTRAFVRTYDHALAQISAERSQHTLALEYSHIDYFEEPAYRADFMTDHGAVLDLREWTMSYAQVPQHYEN